MIRLITINSYKALPIATRRIPERKIATQILDRPIAIQTIPEFCQMLVAFNCNLEFEHNGSIILPAEVAKKAPAVLRQQTMPEEYKKLKAYGITGTSSNFVETLSPRIIEKPIIHLSRLQLGEGVYAGVFSRELEISILFGLDTATYQNSSLSLVKIFGPANLTGIEISDDKTENGENIWFGPTPWIAAGEPWVSFIKNYDYLESDIQRYTPFLKQIKFNPRSFSSLRTLEIYKITKDTEAFEAAKSFQKAVYDKYNDAYTF